jgi:hypothetical protein
MNRALDRPHRLANLPTLPAQLRLHAAAVLLDRPVRLVPANAGEPRQLGAAPAELARDSVALLADLAKRPVSSHRSAPLEPAGASPHPAELALGAVAPGPGTNRPDHAVGCLESRADRNQHRALRNAGDLGDERVRALRLGLHTPHCCCASRRRRPASRPRRGSSRPSGGRAVPLRDSATSPGSLALPRRCASLGGGASPCGSSSRSIGSGHTSERLLLPALGSLSILPLMKVTSNLHPV